MNKNKLQHLISDTVEKEFTIEQQSSVGGGCINQAWRVSGCDQEYFVKLNQSSALDMFKAEFEGLQDLYHTRTLRIPQPLVCDVLDDQSCLVMEYIPLQGCRDAAAMGRQLAAMHQHTAEQFGWHRNNTIGSTIQQNTWENEWVTFWRDHRLGFQLGLAASKGLGLSVVKMGEKLMDGLDIFFKSYQPQASLLHGDLWSGNAACDDQGQPVIFDPAVYYGDREADLAMTELFGGFGADFQAGYRQVWPLDQGYSVRKKLYNLYHILNHFNLFGGSYGIQAGQMMEQLLLDQ